MQSISGDSGLTERKLQAIIFYLTTFGHIDGDFDPRERDFVRGYIETLVGQHVNAAGRELTGEVRAELVQKYTAHFHRVFEQIDQRVQELFTEAVSHEEDQNQFVHSQLKLRCFEIFHSFDRASQEELMETIDRLILADGEAHPAEVKFRAELSELLEADLAITLLDDPTDKPKVAVAPVAQRAHVPAPHPFFDPFEHHYSANPEKITKQLAADRDVVRRAVESFEKAAKEGAGKLSGKQSVSELREGPEFTDGHVVVCPGGDGARYELTVLGDLHGCYSCLKAAVAQSEFFQKVEAYKRDPESAPNPKLVFLGDYIDRGMYSLNGVLRSVLLLYLTVPEHVVVLRGNHEYFVEYKGNIYPGVKPSEAMDTLKAHAPVEVFRDYMSLFETMPSALLADQVMLVHGGIPRDRLFKDKFTDLSSLNDEKMRFEMMWSDPSSADVIPAALQEQTSRFSFGRLQAQRFLQRIGCHTLIRGHEKIDEGFARVYEGDITLCTLFSAGGQDNDDLPMNSSYRSVSPMALTVRIEGGETVLSPWAIDYASYNDPERNAFLKRPPELRFGG